MKKLIPVVVTLFTAGAAHAGIPLLNFTCPGGLEVHADQGGPVYINGKETKLKKSNDNYYEAIGSGVTLSISINPDGSPTLSYTGKHGANGICQSSESSQPSADSNPEKTESTSSTPAVAPGNMAAYCRGEAAGQFATKPTYIKTGKLTRVKGGGYSVKGTADLGDQGQKPFQCKFGKDGKYLGLESLVDEGKL